MTKLTPKKARFLAEYLVSDNGTRAAIDAGYSAKTAAVKAAQLLKDPLIAAAIAEQRERRRKRLEVTADRVAEELAAMAFINVKHLYDQDGNPKAIQDLDEQDARAIVGLEIETKLLRRGGGQSVTRKIKTEKIRALELLGKKFGMFVDRVESRDMTLEQLLCGDDGQAETGGSGKAA